MSLMPAVVQTPEVVQKSRTVSIQELMRLNQPTLRKLLDLNSPPWEVNEVKETKRILATKLFTIITAAGVIGGCSGGAGDGNEGGDGGGDADDRHEDGNNDDGEGGEGDDDGDDEEDDNNNAGSEEEIIQIWVRTNVGTEDFKTYSLWVSPDDTIWTLKAVLRQMLDIPRGMQSLFLHGLCENAELLLEGRIYTMRTTIHGGGKRAAGGAAKTAGKEETQEELQEKVRISMLSVVGNDSISTDARNNLLEFGQALETFPDSVITQALNRFNPKQLKIMGDTAAMGNHGYTMKALAKTIFTSDDLAVSKMIAVLGYIKEAQLRVVELAFASQYHEKPKASFRDEVVLKYGEACANHGRRVAEAEAAARGAVPM